MSRVMAVSAALRRCALCISDILYVELDVRKARNHGKCHLSIIKQLGGANTRRSFTLRFRATPCRVGIFFNRKILLFSAGEVAM